MTHVVLQDASAQSSQQPVSTEKKTTCGDSAHGDGEDEGRNEAERQGAACCC